MDRWVKSSVLLKNSYSSVLKEVCEIQKLIIIKSELKFVNELNETKSLRTTKYSFFGINYTYPSGIK